MSYIIGKQRTEEGFRLFFGKVTGTSKGVAEGYIEKGSHLGPKKRALFEIPSKDIVLDLGTEPHPGKVYGFDTCNIYSNKVIHHDFFGAIHFFYRIKKEVGKKLMAAFDETAKRLTRMGFEPMVDCIWLVQHPETPGKYAGLYKHSRNTEKGPHELYIKPEHITADNLVYVISHEFAHYVHFNLLTQPRINAAWIRLFNTSIKVETIRKDLSLQLLDSLVDGEERPSDFKSGLDEEQKLAWNWILRTIKQDHAISIKELDTLFEADEKDEIKQLWPQRTLHKKDLKPVISEYATLNVRETFAEAFSFYVVKNKIPPNVLKLLEKSIQMAKAHQQKS